MSTNDKLPASSHGHGYVNQGFGIESTEPTAPTAGSFFWFSLWNIKKYMKNNIFIFQKFK